MRNLLAGIVGYSPWGPEHLQWGYRRGSRSFLSPATLWLVLAPVVKLLLTQNDADLGHSHSLALIKNTGCILRGTIPHHCSIGWETKGVAS